ncbi:MAG TPA: cache domain-containing protein [Nitrososphaeraceae archaeon]|nr:cache domain-containing protein [Nitrososphaeraceae archaeon]
MVSSPDILHPMLRSLITSMMMILLILSFLVSFSFLSIPELSPGILSQADNNAITKHPADQNQSSIFVHAIQNNNNSTVLLQLLANRFENRINEAASLLELTSKLPQVRNTQHISSISEEFMGIPENLDLEKRKIAQDILKQDKNIDSIFFLTPKGDIYIGEPFSDQQQLPRLNFADRDWYKGVTILHDTYISAVFLSAAIHIPAVAIAVPVYADNTGNDDDASISSPILGYWVGIVNLNKVKEDIATTTLDFVSSNSSQILSIVDHNGTEVLSIKNSDVHYTSPSSSSTPKNQELKSFANLESVKNALNGKSGSIVEVIDSSKATIYYYPVEVPHHTWAVLLILPSQL